MLTEAKGEDDDPASTKLALGFERRSSGLRSSLNTADFTGSVKARAASAKTLSKSVMSRKSENVDVEDDSYFIFISIYIKLL